MIINNYADFADALIKTGFTCGGGNGEGIFTLSEFFAEKIRSHTDDPETDPWTWRMRVLDERSDIAYAKVFFRKSGFITKEWYPYFFACRRKNRTFDEEYSDGVISNHAKRIYNAAKGSSLPFHEIKRLAGFSKEEASQFERALIDLQMKMYITMCGQQRKVSARGEEFGWNSTVFCAVESFFDSGVFDKASNLEIKEAEEKIRAQILLLNPNADNKKIIKFIYG